MDLIGPYMLKGKDGTEIDFMCVTMIDPATSWFEIVYLLVTKFNSVMPMGQKGRKGTKTVINLKNLTLKNHQHKLAL